MSNTAIVEQITDFAQKVSKERNHSDFQELHLDNLTIEEGMKIDGIPLDETSVKMILSTLNLKPKFLDFKSTLSEQDWVLIGRKIKEARGDASFYGNVINDGVGDGKIITDLIPRNEKKDKADDLTRSNHIIGKITEALSSTEREFDLAGLGFSKKNNVFSIDLVDPSSTFVPFKSEEWKTGTSFNFNSLQFMNNPFLERLACSNGMMIKEKGSLNTNIHYGKFNNDKIAQTILNSINDPGNVDHIVGPQIERLNKINLSIAELLQWRNNLNKMGEEFDGLTQKYMPTDPLFKSYGVDINEMPDQWKRTADSGMNAYNFLNLLTWMASHIKETNIDTSDAANLKILAGDYMFKSQFDMENMAEKIKVEYPVIPEML